MLNILYDIFIAKIENILEGLFTNSGCAVMSLPSLPSPTEIRCDVIFVAGCYCATEVRGV